MTEDSKLQELASVRIGRSLLWIWIIGFGMLLGGSLLLHYTEALALHIVAVVSLVVGAIALWWALLLTIFALTDELIDQRRTK